MLNAKTHSTPLFSKLQVLKLHDIYKFEIAKLMHRNYNKSLNCNSTINKYILLDNFHSHNTRRKQQKNYFIRRVSSKQAQKSLNYIGPKFWNEIPLKVKEINFFKFKKEYKKHVIYHKAGQRCFGLLPLISRLQVRYRHLPE